MVEAYTWWRFTHTHTYIHVHSHHVAEATAREDVARLFSCAWLWAGVCVCVHLIRCKPHPLHARTHTNTHTTWVARLKVEADEVHGAWSYRWVIFQFEISCACRACEHMHHPLHSINTRTRFMVMYACVHVRVRVCPANTHTYTNSKTHTHTTIHPCSTSSACSARLRTRRLACETARCRR